jgi:uncharacterized membrane protein
MNSRASRLVLALSAFVFAVGGLLHARAFHGAEAAIGRANLPSIYARDFKALWLADSTTLLTVAAFFVIAALRPAASTKTLLLLVSVIPAATAVLIYVFVGNFYAGHLLLGAAVAGAVAAVARW